jgi:hypothetical protein
MKVLLLLNLAAEQFVNRLATGNSWIDERSIHNLAAFKNERQNLCGGHILRHSNNGKIGIINMSLSAKKVFK